MPSVKMALGEHGGGGGAVAGLVAGLLGDLVHHLRAHVLELALQFHFLRHRHAVLGDDGPAEGLVDHDVAAGGPEGDGDGAGQLLQALTHFHGGVGAEHHLLACHDWLLVLIFTAEAQSRRDRSKPSCHQGTEPQDLPARAGCSGWLDGWLAWWLTSILPLRLCASAV
jgi:hypothetical protein